jgi:hypothetical protein
MRGEMSREYLEQREEGFCEVRFAVNGNPKLKTERRSDSIQIRKRTQNFRVRKQARMLQKALRGRIPNLLEHTYSIKRKDLDAGNLKWRKDNTTGQYTGPGRVFLVQGRLGFLTSTHLTVFPVDSKLNDNREARIPNRSIKELIPDYDFSQPADKKIPRVKNTTWPLEMRVSKLKIRNIVLNSKNSTVSGIRFGNRTIELQNDYDRERGKML